MTKKIGDTKAHLVYGPYLGKGKLVWWVITDGKRTLFRSKTELLAHIDKITTDIVGTKKGVN